VFNMAGAVLLGTAVADTIGKIVTVPQGQMVAVVGAGLAGATAWNLITWWLGLPSSSGHALVGGLVGAAVADGILSGSTGSVHWGGFDGWHPTGVIGVLVALLISPVLGFAVAFLLLRFLRLVSRRWTTRWINPVRTGGWIAAAGLSFSHGSNDAQKAMGVIAVLLLASGHTTTMTVPLWAKVVTGVALTAGTALGGWRIVKTIGQRIFSLTPLDSFTSQASSTAVILGASLIGAPVSTTQVVASSVVGTGGGRRRWKHVRWQVVREMGVAWLTTMPAAALLAVLVLVIWRAL
jgi:PiT family inorganic phosphate transporter